jgi:hypothetical protein
MSEYGLEITNANSRIIIDSKFKTFYFKESGSTYITYANTPTTLDFGDTTAVPIIGIRAPSNCYAAVTGINMTGSTFTGATITSDTAGVTIAWCVWTQVQKNAIGDYGMVVYNAAGEVVFSANESFCGIIRVVSPGALAIDAAYHEAALSVGGPLEVDITVSDTDNNYFYVNSTAGYSDAGVYTTGGAFLSTAYLFTYGIKRISTTVIRVKLIIKATVASTTNGIGQQCQNSYNSTLMEIQNPSGV